MALNWHFILAEKVKPHAFRHVTIHHQLHLNPTLTRSPTPPAFAGPIPDGPFANEHATACELLTSIEISLDKRKTPGVDPRRV